MRGMFEWWGGTFVDRERCGGRSVSGTVCAGLDLCFSRDTMRADFYIWRR